LTAWPVATTVLPPPFATLPMGVTPVVSFGLGLGELPEPEPPEEQAASMSAATAQANGATRMECRM
ncbi:hypothetical protein, partial [Proteus vulgaris]|uniref:hypothetical protein n=1 Tax=Proteus vulgaris TaxID=585 RepID=UPI00195463C6